MSDAEKNVKKLLTYNSATGNFDFDESMDVGEAREQMRAAHEKLQNAKRPLDFCKAISEMAVIPETENGDAVLTLLDELTTSINRINVKTRSNITRELAKFSERDIHSYVSGMMEAKRREGKAGENRGGLETPNKLA